MIFSAHTFSPITAPLEIYLSIIFVFVRETLFCEEIKNTTEDYQDAPWVPTFELETTASHRCYCFAFSCYTNVNRSHFFLPFHRGITVL